MSKELDDVGVNIGTDKGSDLLEGDVERHTIGEDQVNAHPQHGGAVLGRDMVGLGGISGGVVIMTQGCVQWCILQLQAGDLAHNCVHQTDDVMPCHSMVDNLTLDSVLLSHKCE